MQMNIYFNKKLQNTKMSQTIKEKELDGRDNRLYLDILEYAGDEIYSIRLRTPNCLFTSTRPSASQYFSIEQYKGWFDSIKEVSQYEKLERALNGVLSKEDAVNLMTTQLF